MYAKLLRAFALVIMLSMIQTAFADEPERIDNGYNPNSAPLRTNVQGSAEGYQEFQVQTVLDPRLTAIENDFALRVSALENQIAQLSSGDEQKSLQVQVENLKLQWHMAITRAQIEIATEKGDDKTLAEMSAHLYKLEHPAAPIHSIVRRDPNTGAVLEGGQK